jgi:hypothetical protein
MGEHQASGAGASNPTSSGEYDVGRAWLAPVLIGTFSLAAMFVVAIAEGLPIRDPDARYVGSPLALIAVIALVFIALDVGPRAYLRRKRDHTAAASPWTVLRERWFNRRGVIVGVALLSFYATYLAYRNLKSFIPFVTDADHDNALLDLDRAMFFGQDPATFLHTVLGTGLAAEVLSWIYLAFLTFVPVSLGVALIWSSNLRGGLLYVTSLSLCWIMGAASYYVLPAQGPIYADPRLFSDLPETGVSRLQETLAEHRVEVLVNPDSTAAVQSVAAFASLHIAVVFAAALVAQMLGAHRMIRLGLWTLFALTAVATIYFGWHYLIDDFAGLAIGAGAVAIAARATGYPVPLPAWMRPARQSRATAT